MDKLNEEIEKTLKSLEGIQKVKSNPFLHTRVESALERKPDTHFRKFALAGFYTSLLLATLNVCSVFYYNNSAIEIEVSQTDYATAIQEEYGLSYTYLNIENDEN